MEALCRENDALFILDEVQTGCGLTGTAWAYQQLGVHPDVVAFGKKTQVCGIMAGGRVDDIPDNVFAVSSRINSTWGGNLTDMVRSRRILEIIEEDRLVDRARMTGGASPRTTAGTRTRESRRDRAAGGTRPHVRDHPPHSAAAGPRRRRPQGPGAGADPADRQARDQVPPTPDGDDRGTRRRRGCTGPSAGRYRRRMTPIPLTSVPNLRDVGGYRTRDGAKVRTGVYFRSTDLSRIADTDMPLLDGLGIRTVYDLRTADERDAAPDKLPDGARAVVLDVLADKGIRSIPAQMLQVIADPMIAERELGGGRAIEYFEGSYRDFVVMPSAVSSYRELFGDLASNGNMPARALHHRQGPDGMGHSRATASPRSR